MTEKDENDTSLVQRLKNVWRLSGKEAKSLENPSIPLDPALLETYGNRSDSGEDVTEQTALSITALWNAISIISAHFASFPLHVYQKTDKGREKALKHPANKLISREPNDIMTSYDFRRVMMVSALMRGNGYAEIIRATSTPVRLDFLDADHVDVGTSGGTLVYKYKEYNKDGSLKNTRSIKPDNILHLKGLSLNGVVGLDVIEYHASSLGLSLAQRSLNNEYYLNGSPVSGVIEGALGDGNQRKQLASAWGRAHVGKGSRMGTPVLPAGLTYKPITFTNQQMETLGQMKMSIEDVARMFNIPLHKLKNLDKATNNNIEHQDLEYYKDCLLPWIIASEQEYNKKLLTEKEKREETHYTKHNVNAILRADMQTRATYYMQMRQMKAMSANEVRELEDFDRSDDESANKLENPSIQVNDFGAEKNIE